MSDYTFVSINDAADREMVVKFVENLKSLPPEISAKRIAAIMSGYGRAGCTFDRLMASFNAVAYVKTSAD